MSLVFVSTAPVAEPSVVTFTIPLDICTIVVTVVTLYSSSGRLLRPPCAARVFASRCRAVVFSPGGAYGSLGTVWCRFLEISPSIISSTKRMWVCLHAEFLVQQIRHYLRRQLHLLPVLFAGLCRSAKWELYLYGDKTIKVDRDCSEVLPRSVSPPGIWGVGFGSSPYLATDYTIYGLCLPSERCLGMSMDLVDPVSSGMYCGTCVSMAPAADPAVMSFTVLFYVATAAVGITCFASADCTVSRLQCAAWVFTSGCRGDGSFTPEGAYDSLWDSVEPMTGEYTINFFQYQEDVGCVHAV